MKYAQEKTQEKGSTAIWKEINSTVVGRPGQESAGAPSSQVLGDQF